MDMREYKSGTSWGIWLWTEVPTEYITRLHIIKTPFGSVCIHFLNKPDPEPWLHDHPATFLSIILRGWYIERRERWIENEGLRIYQPRHRWFNFIRASISDRHSIIEVAPGTVTLCFMGPKIRDWGYHMPQGWAGWKDYNDRKYKQLT